MWNSLDQCFGTNLLTLIQVYLKCTRRQRSGKEPFVMSQMALLPHLQPNPCRAQWRPDQWCSILLEEEHAHLRYLIHILYGILWGESCIRSNLQTRRSLFCCSADHTETEEALSFQSAQTGKLQSNCKTHLLNLSVSLRQIKNRNPFCFAQGLKLMRTRYDAGRCQITSRGHNCSRWV